MTGSSGSPPAKEGPASHAVVPGALTPGTKTGIAACDLLLESLNSAIASTEVDSSRASDTATTSPGKDSSEDEHGGFYCGMLKTFSPKDCYGFIQCPYLQSLYGRDVYVHAQEFGAQLPDICCGSLLRFRVECNRRGQPQAKSVSLVNTQEQDDEAAVELMPGLDSFEELATPPVKPLAIGRLLSWNILAPAYATCANFPDAQPVALRWSRRTAQMRSVLDGLQPHVVCLQEVEVDRPLEQLGLRVGPDSFGCSVCRRPGGRSDGCMVLWRADRLKKVREWHISYDDHLDGRFGSEFERFRTGHVAVVVELCLPGDEKVLVATTHLAWGPLAEDVRLWQLHILLTSLQEIECSRVVLCGDFNCVPGGHVHAFMCANFVSAYWDVEPTTATATNAMFQEGTGFAETIDYCWLRGPGMQLQRRLKLPSKEELRKLLGGSPTPAPVPTLVANGSWPSDHLPLAVDLAFLSEGHSESSSSRPGKDARQDECADKASWTREEVSKQLSWILRHGARMTGLNMNSGGWVLVTDLLVCKYFFGLSEERLLEVVAQSNAQKLRYEVCDLPEGKAIRALGPRAARGVGRATAAAAQQARIGAAPDAKPAVAEATRQDRHGSAAVWVPVRELSKAAPQAPKPRSTFQ